MTVTAKDVRDAVRYREITHWNIRTCSVCDAPLVFVFHDDGRVEFDGNCDCTSYHSEPVPSDYEHLATIFNMNGPEMWERFINAGSKQAPAPGGSEGVAAEQPVPDQKGLLAVQPSNDGQQND